MSAVYGAAAPIYLEAGWDGVLYLPPGEKWQPPTGYTGRDGKFPTAAQVDLWARLNSRGNLALRLPDGIIGIDVDHYDAKRGADTLAELEAKYGPLPATWISSARELPSGIRMFRVPPGTELDGKAGDDIDIIQRHHRYICAWPSTNPKAGASQYRWRNPAGEIVDRPPRPDEIPDLPTAWLEGLSVGHADPGGVQEEHHDQRDEEHHDQVRSHAVDRALAHHLADLLGGRHDAAVDGSLALVRLQALRHPGAASALDELGRTFRKLVTGDGTRTRVAADKEWADMVAGARTKVAHTDSTVPPYGDDSDEPDARELTRLAVHIAKTKAVVPGGDFVFNVAEKPEPVWGDGEQVAWSKGEYLLFNGPTGVGKTTILQQVANARIGIGSTLLGMAVEPDDGKVLYLALDRADQIARSLARMVDEKLHGYLNDRLVVWRRPLPVSILKDREIVAVLAEEFGATTVIVDSLKDLAAKLTDDETGQAVKEALTIPCLDGIQVAALHHQRKKQQGGGKPNSLDDVYGSTWITAGAGSVLLVWGEPGDAVVELSHLKPPATPVGPLTLFHDHDHGTTRVEGAIDLYNVVRTSNGLTAEGAARAMFRKDAPSRNEIEKARRQLDRLVAKGHAHKQEGTTGGAAGGTPSRYYAASQETP